MNRFGLKFHHFGLAVRDPADAFRYLKALGYSLAPPVHDPLQAVNLALCSHAQMPDVEVVWPGDEPSPIDAAVKPGCGIVYHLCYTAEDPQEAVAAMEQMGLNVLPVGPPKPAILFGGLEVSFFVVENVGLIEIIRGEPNRFRKVIYRDADPDKY
jgi:hypothetical protein